MKRIGKVLLLAEQNMHSSMKEVARIAEKSELELVKKGAEAGIVIGGDGTFGFYGSRLNLPLLFVGRGKHSELGSKGVLAEVHLNELQKAFEALKNGEYKIENYGKLCIKMANLDKGETFTDVYLQRAIESNALRYELRIKTPRKMIREFAIGDGVIIAASAGATGYFSYSDKIVSGNVFDSRKFSKIGKDEIGICHILPTYIRREGKDEKDLQALRYTVPFGSVIRIMLRRKAQARLYGVGDNRKGVSVQQGESVEIKACRAYTKRIKLNLDDTK
ncbi:MAG: hypothetical protein ACP5SJ_03090 [Candidatus Micrarchaeia archaeon]